MEKTIDELKDDNTMLRFQVEQLWRDLKEARARGDQAVLSKRMGAKINRNIIDDLKAKNVEFQAEQKRLVAALELSDGSTGWVPTLTEEQLEPPETLALARAAGPAIDLLHRVLQVHILTGVHGTRVVSVELANDIEQFLDWAMETTNPVEEWRR